MVNNALEMDTMC